MNYRKKKIGILLRNWQNASEKQLRLRDKIHDNISLLSDIIRDRELLYETAIKKAKEEIC